jgi:tRNA (guanosine-2'-O-)-methyltransferase
MIQPERFHRIQAILSQRQGDLTVVMDRVNKIHNFSAILRSCDAVGILEVHAVPPRHGVRLSDETSAGAGKWVRVRRHTVGVEAIRSLKARGYQIVAAHPDPDAIPFRAVDFVRPTAIVVGAELYGIPDESLALADVTTGVPMMGMVRSLNVSVATALLLYEAQRQREAAGRYAPGLGGIPDDEHTRLLFEWSYPRIAHVLRGRGVPYPALGPSGEIEADLSVLGLEGDLINERQGMT